jgi:putative metalloprotease
MLKANNVNYPIEFKVSDEEDVNAYANLDKEIYVYKGLLEFVDNDEELAGVIGHEMGHIINGHCAKQGVLGVAIALITNKLTSNHKFLTF